MVGGLSRRSCTERFECPRHSGTVGGAYGRAVHSLARPLPYPIDDGPVRLIVEIECAVMVMGVGGVGDCRFRNLRFARIGGATQANIGWANIHAARASGMTSPTLRKNKIGGA